MVAEESRQGTADSGNVCRGYYDRRFAGDKGGRLPGAVFGIGVYSTGGVYEF